MKISREDASKLRREAKIYQAFLLVKESPKLVSEIADFMKIGLTTANNYLLELVVLGHVNRQLTGKALCNQYIYTFISDYFIEIEDQSCKKEIKHSNGHRTITKTQTGYIVQGGLHQPIVKHKSTGARWTGECSLGSF